MYPPALKGLFNFLCMRPHTHECNYIWQRSFPLVAILRWQEYIWFWMDQYISIQVIREREHFPRCPFSTKWQKKKRKEKGKWIEGIGLWWEKKQKKNRALIKNRKRNKNTVTQTRWKEKQNKIKPRRQLGAPWLRLISGVEERKCCCMEIQPGRPAAGRGGDAERPGRRGLHVFSSREILVMREDFCCIQGLNVFVN